MRVSHFPSRPRRYFDALESEGGAAQRSHSATLVLIGNGEAGKTSLLRTSIACSSHLMDLDARTIAVDISDWRPEGHGDANLELRCWDMAGQRGYHGFQQLFLNPHALYVMVWDATTDDFEDSVLYWLRLLNARCPRATVLPVATKMAKAVKAGFKQIERLEAYTTALRQLQTENTTLHIVFPPISACSMTMAGIDEFTRAVCSLCPRRVPYRCVRSRTKGAPLARSRSKRETVRPW